MKEKDIRVLEEISFKKTVALDLEATSLPASGSKLISSAQMRHLQEISFGILFNNIASNKLTDDDILIIAKS